MPEPSTSTTPPSLQLTVNGVETAVADRGQNLLELIREDLGLVSAKDGCSPQGQCGCCTVLVDGKPRVACVTPARRVRGRSVTTLEGLDGERRERWADALCAVGGSQCGFCTPGIVMRLAALADDAGDAEVDNALLAHLCRCTGWQTIREARRVVVGEAPVAVGNGNSGHDRNGGHDRDLAAAARRAEIEGRAPQAVGPEVAIGLGGFVADSAPPDALVAVPAADGTWAVADRLGEARRRSGKVQGRRTTADHGWPIEVPPAPSGAGWAATLRTTWVEPAYLEPDAAWCSPGAEPVGGAANGGAFGAKGSDGLGGLSGLDLAATARSLADEHGRPVLVLTSREDVTRWGAKRPPIAGGISDDGTGILRAAVADEAQATALARAVAAVVPGLVLEPVSVVGPPTSALVRGAGWVEAVVLAAAATGTVGIDGTVIAPDGGRASAVVDLGDPDDPVISVRVSCGEVLDATVLRSYCIGAAHMAWSWLTSESLTVAADGTVQDLTIRSFGVVRAVDTPRIEVEIEPSSSAPVNGSDAVFAAVAAAAHLALGCPHEWPAPVLG